MHVMLLLLNVRVNHEHYVALTGRTSQSITLCCSNWTYESIMHVMLLLLDVRVNHERYVALTGRTSQS